MILLVCIDWVIWSLWPWLGAFFQITTLFWRSILGFRVRRQEIQTSKIHHKIFYFGFKTIFFFSLASSKLTFLLILRKVTPFFIIKYNTLISTFYSLGLFMAKGSLLSFLHFSTKKMNLLALYPPPHNPFEYWWKKLKFCA